MTNPPDKDSPVDQNVENIPEEEEEETTDPTNEDTAGNENIKIEIHKTNDWGSGAQYEFTFTNISNSTVSDMIFDLNITPSSIWNVIYNNGTITLPSWNLDLSPGESLSGGFVMSGQTISPEIVLRSN